MSFDSRSVSRWVGSRRANRSLRSSSPLSDLIEPAWSDDSAEYLREVADRPGPATCSGPARAIGGVALLAGMIGVARLLRGGRRRCDRRRRLVARRRLGGARPAACCSGWRSSRRRWPRARNPAEMVALYDGTEDVWLALVAFGTLFLRRLRDRGRCSSRRAADRRPVPLWSPLLLIAWVVTIFVSPNRWVNLAATVLIPLAAFAPVAARIAGMRNEQWERWQPLPDREARPPQAARASSSLPARRPCARVGPCLDGSGRPARAGSASSLQSLLVRGRDGPDRRPKGARSYRNLLRGFLAGSGAPPT